MKPLFIISLDFELYWGIRDSFLVEEYEDNLNGVHQLIPLLLKLFKKYEIHCTWASVGFLLNENMKELKENIPGIIPNYESEKLNPYNDPVLLNKDVNGKPYFITKDLFLDIINCKGQEIGSHTYSHYYCLEKGQEASSFKSDLDKFDEMLLKKYKAIPSSIVFPRNQVNTDYFKILKDKNYTCYRGSENHWAYKPDQFKNYFTFKKRLFRFIDSFYNISGHHCFVPYRVNGLINIPASKFFQPYKPFLFESLKLRRIKKSMLHAAKNNLAYHLWWHPHNFGKNIPENINALEEILKYYSELNKIYKMESKNMKEVADEFIKHE